MMNGYKGKRNTDQQVIYAFGHVEGWLEIYAKSTGQSATELCSRVGTLLLAQGSGAIDNMPEPGMQSYSTSRSLPMGKMEVAEHAHGGVHGRKSHKKTRWTPAMRRAASLRMKKHQAKLQAARRAAQTTTQVAA